ncbi:hypothetical protein D8674_041537 [Pyrus ussuriensis x Pyrus communis]|uniref:Uncharacterized protein n=1 Tax=Pyrus ussuriensis x Pyrus communis TaxID=2448454 RepID=A0A5N5I107_9ROSA|nr:hypothetical protein D8674_041537 [Pyrus ussuriensis x Pyrus communis]
MKERSREMGSSPPTAEEIFRDYCAPRTDVVHSLTNGILFVEREDVSSRVFCFIPFLSSKKLIAASQTLFLSRTAIPGAAAAQRQGLQRRRFVKPSLLKQISNDETCKEEAATGPTYRD